MLLLNGRDERSPVVSNLITGLQEILNLIPHTDPPCSSASLTLVVSKKVALTLIARSKNLFCATIRSTSVIVSQRPTGPRGRLLFTSSGASFAESGDKQSTSCPYGRQR